MVTVKRPILNFLVEAAKSLLRFEQHEKNALKKTKKKKNILHILFTDRKTLEKISERSRHSNTCNSYSCVKWRRKESGQ